MLTTGDYKYVNAHIMLMDTYRFTFKVKTSHGAHIALCEIPGNTNTLAWEVGIQTGSNNESFIRMGVHKGTKPITVNTPNFLSATDFNEFWITWTDKVLCILYNHKFNMEFFNCIIQSFFMVFVYGSCVRQ